MEIDPILKEIAGVFASHNKSVFLVGGAVRDILRGVESHDFDLATDAVPEEVIAMFRVVIPTGIKHGTVTVRYRGLSIEVTTFRTEADYLDGRHPSRVAYAATIEADLGRRDFTMNAVAAPLPGGKPLVDPFNGIGDIKRGVICSVGEARERFSEDGLRPLRALRFVAQLGFSVEEKTLAAIKPCLEITAKVSLERIRDELDKIIATPKPSGAFLLMEKTGLLELVLPELAACRGVEQKGLHRFDVLDHSLLACDFAARRDESLLVRLAALFHDIGKPSARALSDDGVWTFYQHEKTSATLCRALMTRLHYSGAMINDVTHLIGEHMFHYEDIWTNAAVRRFIQRVGVEHLDALYRLRLADASGITGREVPADYLAGLVSRVDAALAQSAALSLKDLALTGHDLMAIGIKPGRLIGIILNELLETVLDDPELNTREKLLEIAGKLNQRYAPQEGVIKELL
ncbi:MAG: CCA tRNA nucleotidyltransferase [Treponema sp.]|jgi:putative nucleotidyltransferase with HDIG domain|nr:CCA tRNA nucleotidyltransferase [Treponema sp.]